MWLAYKYPIFADKCHKKMSLEKQTLIEENLLKVFSDESFQEMLSPEDYKNYLSAKQNLKNGEMIFIGGSNFVVGEFLEKNLQK